MAKKGSGRNKFKIIETHLDQSTVTLKDVRTSMTDWFEQVLNLSKKLELQTTNSHSIIQTRTHSKSNTRGGSNL